MAFPIIPKRRSGATGNPSTLELGELATNTQTGELFLGGDGGVMLLNPPTAAGTTVTEHTGDGTTTAFTFAGYSSTDDGAYIVSVGGIDQPPSKYSVSATAGGTITFVEAPVAGELISIRAIVAGGGGGGGITELTGDVTASGTGSVAATLASVTTAQSNVGSATAIPVLSVDEKGRVTALATTPIGSTSTDVQVFTANGTWTKPAGARAVRVEIMAGGGGGGGGGRASTGACAGGAGGAGAGILNATLLPQDLTSTVAVTIGAGGIGGAGKTSDSNGNGTIGQNGGTSSFGAYLQVLGASGGTGGTVGAPHASVAGNYLGNTGGAGGYSGTGVGTTGGSVSLGAPGGGGGGAINSTSEAAGGSGGASIAANLIGGIGGTIGGGAGGNGNAISGWVTLNTGSGGGGGGGSLGGIGGAGGNGGGFGSGGGGGGATQTGTGGTGGNGASGIVIVTTYF